MTTYIAVAIALLALIALTLLARSIERKAEKRLAARVKITPQVDHGRADIYKPADKLLCVQGDIKMGLTKGKVYLVPFLANETYMPVYNDFGGLSFPYPDRFKLYA